MYPFVSIIIPVRNEEKNLPRLFSSLKKLNYPEKYFEVIIVDGLSTDQTVLISKNYQARVFKNRKIIRGAGCQIGIRKAKGDLVAFTDADCVVPRKWLKEMTPYFADDKVGAIGGPNVTPKDDTNFAKAVSDVLWVLTRTGSRYGFQSIQVGEIYHNPGCNVIYRKNAIQAVGGFNSELLTCEDEELDFRLRQNGWRILFTAKISVDHYRRSTYHKIFLQSYRFAIGRAQAILLHPQMARWFHFVPSFFLISLMVFPLAYVMSGLGILLTVYLFLALFIFLTISVFLQVYKKTTYFYVYLVIILTWFLGWGLGFIKGFLNERFTFQS